MQAWLEELRPHVRRYPGTALGLALSLAALAALLVHGGTVLVERGAGAYLGYALAGGGAGFAATALGALPALALRRLAQSVEDSMLGFAAGMMLAAASFSLLLPGLEAGAAELGNPLGGAVVVVVGMGLGVLLLLGLDRFVPHEHVEAGPCGPGHERYARVWLFVFAIALHNLPEGMAIGVGFARGDLGVGLPLATAIAVQDLPEGLAVALSLRATQLGAGRAVLVAAATGLLEPFGALLGVTLAGGLSIAYPIGLGLAAGAMIFVVSHEVIPETHRHGHQTRATLGLMVGFCLMMVLDTSLG